MNGRIQGYSQPSMRRFWLIAIVVVLQHLLTACAVLTPQKPEAPVPSGHISRDNAQQSPAKSIPEPVSVAPIIPSPQPQKSTTYHTAVVNNVPVKDLLFTLARDANLNLDVDSNVESFVTLNAINQPLEVLLDRIVESAKLNYEIKNDVLRVSRDTPYLKTYQIDYINMSRSSASSSTVSTQIQSTGGSAEGGSSGNNNSLTEVKNISNNYFWETLSQNIALIIADNNAAESGGGTSSGSESDGSGAGISTPVSNRNILVNSASGVIAVRATKKQHRDVEQFIDDVLYNARRQVLIEATIAEVTLNDSYQAGIDWSVFKDSVDKITEISSNIVDIELFNRPSFTIANARIDGDKTLQGTLSALQTFGDVTIMSSPKVMALNNQTALLKVVDNVVYFTVEVNIETSSNTTGGSTGLVTYETEVNTVPVGFVMSVTPFINDTGSVTLNIRPTISRIIGQARDPNPSLAQVGVISEIPVIQVREVESLLKVNNGDIAVMGGLMQDEQRANSRGVPFLAKIPFVGGLFRYDNDSNTKTELVIFIRPVVINRASVDTDLRDYSRYLPENLN